MSLVRDSSTVNYTKNGKKPTVKYIGCAGADPRLKRPFCELGGMEDSLGSRVRGEHERQGTGKKRKISRTSSLCGDATISRSLCEWTVIPQKRRCDPPQAADGWRHLLGFFAKYKLKGGWVLAAGRD
ncbi:hypothetical protein E2C01_059204 [Portunus trituberculatus]|uniref:Uncharacterized protein n=1 Tax=Portunus trituberculatus TaxID=210409 RepID=A0A5B7H7P5_PORTR|nr:hypothetical protein [Portunus trituberculatus]